MKKIKNFMRWYFNENAKYYARCMELHVNPFLP